MEATPLWDTKLIATFNIIFDNAFPRAQLDDFSIHQLTSITIIQHKIKQINLFEPLNSLQQVMQRNKSTKQSQSQLLKEVLAEFDIETQINKIAIRCFNDLQKSNKQAYDVLAQSEKKITQFESRLCKTQGFAESIEKNVSNKIEIANNLNKRLQIFNTEFYQGMKGNQHLIQTMRKDYDSLVSSTQKNTYELRNLSDNLKKNNQSIRETQYKVEEQISKFSHKINENEVKSEKQYIQLRLQCEKMRGSLTEARTEYLAKSASFEEISKDMTLYKFEKDTINNRISEIMKQIDLKLNKNDFNQMRLLFDSRITTDQENNFKHFSELRASLKEEKQQRKTDVKNINSDSTAQWNEQQKTNQSVYSRITQLRNEMLDKFVKMASKNQSLEIALRKEIQTLLKKQENNNTWVRNQLSKQSKKIQQNLTKINDCDRFMQERYDQIVQLTSTLTALTERVDSIAKQNQNRKKELTRIQSSQKQNQKGESSMNDIISRLQDQLYQNNQSFIALKKEVEELKQAEHGIQNQLQKQKKEITALISSEKVDSQQKFTEINRHINDVSIEIMNNIHNVELESKSYVDGLIQTIRSKLQFLDQVNQQIKDLKKAFEEQMVQTKAVNQSISDKMQKSNAAMTKFKSDISLRVQAIINQQQRRSLEIKQFSKLVDDIRKHMGYLTQGICVAMSIIAFQSYLEDNEGGKDIKISSLLEGWVLEIDEKQARYRGQPLHKRKLVLAFLNFFIFNCDKIKGGLIESGKDIYTRMMDQSQEIFTARKRGMSKKVGSQLPKLHY